jgi:hypothetical protein
MGLHAETGGNSMQIIQMIWNGIGGLGAGTVVLKSLFIMFLGAVFWMLCELVKFVINVFAKLAVDALRYLAIVVRGWPKDMENIEEKKDATPFYRTER